MGKKTLRGKRWSALTDLGRVTCWLGEFEGDLHSGDEYRRRYFSSGAEVAGRVESCEPGRRFRVANGECYDSDIRMSELIPTYERLPIDEQPITP